MPDEFNESETFVFQKTLDSDANILKVNQETLDSDYYIKEPVQETLDSDAKLKASSSETIDSDSYIKVSNDEILNSSMFIGSAREIDSDAFILKETQETLDSDAFIEKQPQETLDSDANIKKSTEETINSDLTVKEPGDKNLFSKAHIKKTTRVGPKGTDSSIVGQWKLDESPAQHGTTISDSSSQSNDGTFTTNDGATDKSINAKFAGGISFDGTDDEIIVPDDSSLDFGTGDFSISFFIKSDSTFSSAEYIMTKEDVSGIGFDLSIVSMMGQEYISLGLSFGSYGVTAGQISGNFHDGRWHHIAFSVDRDGNCNGYLDGVLNDFSDISTYSSDSVDTNEDLVIGSFISNALYFSGSLDNITLYNRAITINDVRRESRGLGSAAWVSKEETETLDSDAYIIFVEQETLDSDAYIEKEDTEGTIESDAYIKKIDNEETLNSDAFIEKVEQEDIDSDAYILKETTQTLDSDAYIKKLDNEETLDSDIFVIKGDTKTIDSDSYILKETQQTIQSDAYIKKASTETLDSDARIVNEYTKTLDSDSYIKVSEDITIQSISYIKKLDNEETINSDGHIVAEVSLWNDDPRVWFLVEETRTIDSDAVIEAADVANSITSDAYIQEPSTQPFSIDGSYHNKPEFLYADVDMKNTY